MEHNNTHLKNIQILRGSILVQNINNSMTVIQNFVQISLDFGLLMVNIYSLVLGVCKVS